MIGSLSELDEFRAVKLPSDWPANMRSLFSPVDRVHEGLIYLLKSVQHSLVISMFGYDDDDANAVVRSYIANRGVYVQINLDRSQAGGVHERKLLASWSADEMATSIAIGTSSGHAISHLKMAIIDGQDVVTGSTNWSLSGEQKQDNHLIVVRDPTHAAECRSRLDAIHQNMLEQMKNRAKIPAGLLVDASVA